MTFHLQEGLNLTDGQVLPVSQCNELIEGTKQLISILYNFPFVQALASTGNNLGEKMQGVDVLEDIGLAVGNEDHVELVERLVYEADIVLFDGSVLGSTVGKLGEGGEESFDSRPGHLAELSREDSFAPAGANRCCEDNLEDSFWLGQSLSDMVF